MNTPQTWSEIGFEVEITGDGSPTLRLMPGECMHHSGGAAEETELIYGQVIRQCFEQTSQPHFLSVGLGLGYVEMTVAREALIKQNLNFTLESFELVPELREYLKQWLNEEMFSSEISSVYDSVLEFVLLDSKSIINPKDVKKILLEKMRSGQWTLKGPLVASSDSLTKAICIVISAFR